jgi:hypothetical protein
VRHASGDRDACRIRTAARTGIGRQPADAGSVGRHSWDHRTGGAAADQAEAKAAAADARTEPAEQDKRRAEAALSAERTRADALRTTIDELKAGQSLMQDMHARELAVAQHDALVAQQAAADLRLAAEAARKATGLVAWLRLAWRGE